MEGHAVGHVTGFVFVPDPDAVGDERRLVLRAARRALRGEMPRRVAALEDAADAAFVWQAPTGASAQYLEWDGARVARLRPGATAARPAVEVADSEFLDGTLRERVRLRLVRFIEAEIAAVLAPLTAAVRAGDADPALRGVLHRLREGLGIAPVDAEAEAVRGRLKAVGARAGRHAILIPALLKPRAATIRARLLALMGGLTVPDLPRPGQVSTPPNPAWATHALALGWVAAGPVLLRPRYRRAGCR